ncbi:crotonobetaine/carnitine-CoA ligase [Rhodoligotrophos appendicifer]|uniref:AMP-binding protein n=1 Tax=Rhodoligotrophos appendicifer TaxID=987056 RepID=UPI001184FEC9|nr:AMP-binding protein [Rhodoligotrophos appendicifer]
MTLALPALIEERASRLPDRRFLTLTTGASRSYGEIEQVSRRLAAAFAELGLARGDRLLLMLPSMPEFIEAWFATNRLGAVIVTVNTAYVGDYLAHIVRDSGAAIIVAATAHLPSIAAILPEAPTLHTVIEVPDGAPSVALPATVEHLHFADLLLAPARSIAITVTERDPGAIIYTSGTTGRSKGVVMPHGQLRANPDVYIDQLGLTSRDVLYSCLPLFHANALLLGVLGALILETEIVLSPQFSASRWLAHIREHKVTATNLLGVMVEFILKQPEDPGDADTALRIATAVPTSPELGPRFERRFGVQLIELYGSTELNCPLFHPRHEPRRPRSCGRIVADRFEARLVDPETDEEVPTGTPGELVVRPKKPWTTMLAYHNRPESTLEAWRNLWFHTGDVMRRDDEGYFFFLDRAKDAIRRRGENISSFEVEEVLRSHPDVAEVAVIGVASPYDALEQEVKACVVVKTGSACDAATLAAHCAARMPDFARPRFIELMVELPKTPTQKIRKAELRTRGITPETWVDPQAAGRAKRPETSNV